MIYCMRLILATIILTVFAQPVWAASTYACSSGLAIVAQLDSVEEFQNFEFAFSVNEEAVTFSQTQPFQGSIWKFSDGGSYIGDEFWLINQPPYDIVFANNKFQFISNKNMDDLNVFLIHARCK